VAVAVGVCTSEGSGFDEGVDAGGVGVALVVGGVGFAVSPGCGSGGGAGFCVAAVEGVAAIAAGAVTMGT
jgi:hypothetical protein